jgi:hypothetical protein
MGIKDEIKRKMDADKRFAKDIENEQAMMDTATGKFVASFQPFVDSFYSKNEWTGYKMLGQSVKRDLQSEASFSLDEITKLIDRTAKALLAGNVAGLLTAPKEDIKAAATGAASVALGGSTDFIVSAAVATITSVLNLFSAKASGQLEQGMESHRIAPGLMLHAYGYSSLSSAETQFENASLVMSAIGYQLIWCAAQQNLEQDMTFMSFISEQLVKQEAALDTMRAKLLAMEEDPDSDDTKIEHFKRRLADVEAGIQNFRKQSDDLVAKFSKGKLTRA